jgi:hypothetical protein
MICITKYYWGDQTNKNETGRSLRHVWGKTKGAYRVWRGKLTETAHLEDLGVDGRIILKLFSKIEMRGIDWLHLAQDRERWLPIVNSAMNFRVP